MTLEHLLQGYKLNKINATINSKIENNKEKAGVINFNNNINASYLLDKEDMVIAFTLFINCTMKNKALDYQIKHCIDTINVIQYTIELIANIKREEINNLMMQLGLFNNKIETKAVKLLNYAYKVEIKNGLLWFTIIEDTPSQI